jgi:RNA polymerase sigma-70 factor (ECF subfamily)
VGINQYGFAANDVHTIFNVGTTAGLTDGQLLERFASGNDGRAFEALVVRHGPMVLRTCRRLLGDDHDADDAFQATFFVLARRARSIRTRDGVAPWLRRVATRTATKLRVSGARRDAHGQRYASLLQSASPTRISGGPDPAQREVALVVREEIERLPSSYREPVILCFLDGLKCEEAAQELGRPVGTITVQLARARDRLRSSLQRRGVVAPAGLLAAGLATTADACPIKVSTSLTASTIKAARVFAAGRAAASGVVPARAAAVAEGVLKNMFTTRAAVSGALALSTLCAGAGLAAWTSAHRNEENLAAVPAASRPPARADDNPTKSDEEKLQGTWPALSIEGAGGKSEGKGSEADLFKLIITQKNIVFEGALGQNNGAAKGTIKLDATKHPKEMDMEIEQGKLLGIYELDGDTLKICLNKLGVDERPTEFTANDSRYVYVFQREKP